MPSMTSQARSELKRSRWRSFVAASFLTLVAFAQCGCDRQSRIHLARRPSPPARRVGCKAT